MPTNVDQCRLIFESLITHIKAELSSLRSLNLGVTSGSDLSKMLILQRLRKDSQQLSLLCISSDLCSDEVGRMARSLSKEELSNLQVLLDSQNLDELSDFIRMMVYNTGDSLAKEEVGKAPKMHLLHSANKKSMNLATNKLSTIETQSVRKRGQRSQIQDADGLKFASLSPDSLLTSTAKAILKLRQLPEFVHGSEEAEIIQEIDEDELALSTASPLYSLDPIGRSLGPCTLTKLVRGDPEPPPARPIYTDNEKVWKKSISTFTKDVLLGSTYLQKSIAHLAPHLDKQRQQQEVERLRDEELSPKLRAGSPRRALYSPAGFNSMGRRAGSFVAVNLVLEKPGPK